MRVVQGSSVPITSSFMAVSLVFSWIPRDDVTVSMTALLLDNSGRVRDQSFVIDETNPTEQTASVEFVKGSIGGCAFVVDFDRIPVEHVVFAISVGEGDVISDLPKLSMVVNTAAQAIAMDDFGLSLAGGETVAVLVEMFKADSGWHVLNFGQGWQDGAAGALRDFGAKITVPVKSVRKVLPASPVTILSAPDGSLRVDNADGMNNAVGVDWMNPPVPVGYETGER